MIPGGSNSVTSTQMEQAVVLGGSLLRTVHPQGARLREEVDFGEGHTNAVESAMHSPDGKTIVSASDDQTIRLWDAATGEQLRILKGHEGSVYSAMYSPDGKTIVSASMEQDRPVVECSYRRATANPERT